MKQHCIVYDLTIFGLIGDIIPVHLQNAMQQKGEAEQRAAVSQVDLELRQARQQLIDARREAADSRLEVDRLKTWVLLLSLSCCPSLAARSMVCLTLLVTPEHMMVLLHKVSNSSGCVPVTIP